MGERIEFVPNGKAIWQSDEAKTYQCPHCLRPIYTQYEGEAQVIGEDIECAADGHTVYFVERN